jgi:hypothetical protein
MNTIASETNLLDNLCYNYNKNPSEDKNVMVVFPGIAKKSNLFCLLSTKAIRMLLRVNRVAFV